MSLRYNLRDTHLNRGVQPFLAKGSQPELWASWRFQRVKIAIIDASNRLACWSQRPRALRRRSSAACPLRLWVRIPPGAWMFVCCECCVLTGRGLCDGLITRPEESYRLWRVVVCDQETSKNEEAKACYRAVKIQPQWVVTPGKQQTNTLLGKNISS
jgi:hypothetical protein